MFFNFEASENNEVKITLQISVQKESKMKSCPDLSDISGTTSQQVDIFVYMRGFIPTPGAHLQD